MSTKKPTLNELLEAVNGELETQKKQLEDKISSYTKKTDELVSKENELNAKELALIEREKEVKRGESEIEIKWGKIRRDDEVAAQYNQVLIDRDKIKKERKEITDLIAENNFKLDTIKKKEQEMCVREATYKEKIEKELTRKVIGLN